MMEGSSLRELNLKTFLLQEIGQRAVEEGKPLIFHEPHCEIITRDSQKLHFQFFYFVENIGA